MAVHPLHNEDVCSMHGIPMTEEAFEQITNLESPYRYELIDGFIYDMTGSSPEHADIAYNSIISKIRGREVWPNMSLSERKERQS